LSSHTRTNDTRLTWDMGSKVLPTQATFQPHTLTNKTTTS